MSVIACAKVPRPAKVGRRKADFKLTPTPKETKNEGPKRNPE